MLDSAFGWAPIDKIISDTEIQLKRPFTSPETLNFLKRNPSLYCWIPVLDPESVYESVDQAFNDGDMVGIFPEGGSHDQTTILPLKAGVAIMALRFLSHKLSEEDLKGTNICPQLSIVPCGLCYFSPDEFRSKASVEFGTAVMVESSLVLSYKQGGSERRAAISSLLTKIREALLHVTISSPDYELLQLAILVKNLYRPRNRRLSLCERNEIIRRFIEAYHLMQDQVDIQKLKANIIEYQHLLRVHGLYDSQISSLVPIPRYKAIFRLAFFCVFFIVLLVFSIPGKIMNFPIRLVAIIIAEKKAKQALQRSSVKITGKDVIATWKLITACIIAPIMFFLYSLILFALLKSIVHENLIQLMNLYPVSVFLSLYWVALPMISWSAILAEESGTFIQGVLPILVSAAFYLDNTQSISYKLKTKRNQLRASIVANVDKYGPQIFPQFEYKRIISHPTSKKQSGGLSMNNGAKDRNNINSDIRPINECMNSSGDSIHSSNMADVTSISQLLSLRKTKSSKVEDWSNIGLTEMDDIFLSSGMK